MATSTSRSSERRARGAALVAAAMVLSAAAVATAQEGTLRTAKQDPRAGAQGGVGVPYPALVLQAGKDEQRLTGSFAYSVGGFTFDVKLTGANVSKTTQQSLLFD